MVFDIIEEKELQGYIANVNIADDTKKAILRELNEYDRFDYNLENAVIKEFQIEKGKAIITSDFDSDQKNILEFVEKHSIDGKTLLYEIYKDVSKAKEGARKIFEDESKPWEELVEAFGKANIILIDGKSFAKNKLYKHDNYTLKKAEVSGKEPVCFLLEFDGKSKDYQMRVLDFQKQDKKITI